MCHSYYASVFPSLRVPHPPSSKRARLMLTSPGRPQIITQLPRKQSPTLSHQQQQPQPQSQPQTQSQTQCQQPPQTQQPSILHQQQNQTTFQDELPSIIAQLKTYSKFVLCVPFLLPPWELFSPSFHYQSFAETQLVDFVLHTILALCILRC